MIGPSRRARRASDPGREPGSRGAGGRRRARRDGSGRPIRSATAVSRTPLWSAVGKQGDCRLHDLGRGESSTSALFPPDDRIFLVVEAWFVEHLHAVFRLGSLDAQIRQVALHPTHPGAPIRRRCKPSPGTRTRVSRCASTARPSRRTSSRPLRRAFSRPLAPPRWRDEERAERAEPSTFCETGRLLPVAGKGSRS